MPSVYEGIRGYWDDLPIPAQVLLSGSLVGVVGNYLTRILDFVFMTLFSGSIRLQFQIAMIFIGVSWIFDLIHRARLNRTEQSVKNKIDQL